MSKFNIGIAITAGHCKAFEYIFEDWCEEVCGLANHHPSLRGSGKIDFNDVIRAPEGNLYYVEGVSSEFVNSHLPRIMDHFDILDWLVVTACQECPESPQASLGSLGRDFGGWVDNPFGLGRVVNVSVEYKKNES
jgi:hypothetical protein